jgi:hypothetical protein
MRRRIAAAPAVLLLCSCYDWSQAREDAAHDAHAGDDARADVASPDDAETAADGPCADPDRDDDGVPARECGGSDCDDGNPAAWPGAPDNAGRWLVEVVHADVGDASHLVLDRSDRPHFAFVQPTPTGVGLFHHWKDGDSWPLETVDERAVRAMGFAALAPGPSDDLHAAYTTDVERGPRDLRHAVRAAGGTWSTDVAGSLGDFGMRRGALAVDGRGTIHVAYSEDGVEEDVTLRVASSAPGGWTVSTVPVPAEGDVGVALAVGPDDALHVAWSTWSSEGGALIHAVRGPDETAWRVETVTTHILAAAPSLAIDAAGHAHLFAASADGTPYATDATGAWTFEAIDPSGVGGSSGALALDPDGVPGIAYAVLGWDLTDELRWARRTAAGWVREEVPGARGVDQDGTSAAIDSTGRAHLLFRHGADLVYAAEQPGGAADGIDQDCDGVDG